MWKLYQGDVREKLAELPEKSVQCVVTSPPYWGLRSYLPDGHEDKKAELGLEKTPEEYVEKMVQVFREVKRVLRDDGTLWLNLGDSYSTHASSSKNHSHNFRKPELAAENGIGVMKKGDTGLPEKNLVGIPWKVAFALQANGWILRNDIIWHKPNPTPGGQGKAFDRFTVSHEYIFFFAKSHTYYFDGESIRTKTMARPKDVWKVATHPYTGAHFATFPPKLIEPCILAGSSPKACEKCGAPWERVVEKKRINRQTGKEVLGDWGDGGDPANQHKGGFNSIRPETHTKTLGWRLTCTCQNEGKGRCTVLDPFAGSGTTLYVAEQYGRDSIGIELSEEYCKLIHKRMDKMQQTILGLGVQ